MQIRKSLKQRFRWYHPVAAIVCIGCYILILRPLRMAFQREVQLPLLQWVYNDFDEIRTASDGVGTGTLITISGTEYLQEWSAVLGAPAGIFFILTLVVMILMTSPIRYILMLLYVHLGSYAAALVIGISVGFTTPNMILFVPLIQQYLLPAVSFALLFFALRDIAGYPDPGSIQ